MNINVAMKRITRQIKHDDEFKPSTVSIREMCELHDGQKYFNQIRNRIYRELDQNLDLGDYIYIDLKDKEDIRLTGDGVFIFFEILAGYFDENHVRDLCMYLCRKNRCEEMECQLTHCAAKKQSSILHKPNTGGFNLKILDRFAFLTGHGGVAD